MEKSTNYFLTKNKQLMSKFTKLYLLLAVMFLTSSVVFAQGQYGISQEEKALMENPVRIMPGPDAQTQTMPAEKMNAPMGVQNPNSGRATTDILLSLTVDSWWGEATYNLWSYFDGAYWWATNQSFTYANENQQHVLPLEDGTNYDVDCWDTYGDGGITGDVSNNTTTWPITSWSGGDYTTFGSFPFTAGPGTQPAEITTFPYITGFESGSMPVEFIPSSLSGSFVSVKGSAAYQGSYGLQFEGNTSTGWGSTPYSYSAAFDPSKASHHPQTDITIVPDGQAGLLRMSFMMQQGYSFNPNYCWFRVLLNGTELYEMNSGAYYWQPSTHSDPFQELVFDLSPWQSQRAPFTVTLQASVKYYENYYQQGDIVNVDDFKVWYELPPGAVEGYTFNGQGLVVAGATVGIDGVGQTTSGPDGYYLLDPVPVGDHDLQGWKSGYNVVTYPITVFTMATTYQDIILTAPTMIISPLTMDKTLPPNGFEEDNIDILNTGDGPLDWFAEIIYTSDASDGYQQDITQVEVRDFSNIDPDGEVNTIPRGNGQAMNTESFDCPDGTVFGYPAVGSDNGYTSDGGAGYQCYQSFAGATGSFTTVTGYAIHTSAPSDRELQVEVYQPGSSPGALVSSTVAIATPVNTGIPVIGYDTYSYTVEIPSCDLTDGWVSIMATGGSPTYYWLNTYATPAYPALQNSTALPSGLAMCLSGSGGGDWLSLGQYEGTVGPMGQSFSCPIYFDATGFESGDYVTADVVFTSFPDVGTTTVAVSMLVIGDPLGIPENLVVELDNPITGQVGLTWDFTPAGGVFQYFIVRRDGSFVGTTTDLFYTDFLPDFGEYCYTVQAVYDVGTSAEVGPECILWPNPELVILGAPLWEDVWVDHQEVIDPTLAFENTGVGPLAFDFPDYSSDAFNCTHTIRMYDSYGDGWNGGLLTVYVNGNAVLTDITLQSGGGPEDAYFNADAGDEITSTFVCGSWCYENSYEVIDGAGNIIAVDGASGNPTGIPAGTCYAFCPQPSFITDVVPASGIINEGETVFFEITYDATGFAPGLYEEWLNFTTNDPNFLSDSVFNEMLVYEPAQFYGYVTDCNTGAPIAGVAVTADIWSTTTDGNGYYQLYVDEGTYTVDFDKVGYQNHQEVGIYAAAGAPVELNIDLCEELYRPGWVTATPNYPDDTECVVEWTTPWGAYEILYDDGQADAYLVYNSWGNAHAVKFTPPAYPATVVGGKVYVGDGSFPAGQSFIGSTFGAAVLDDDGDAGMPGTVLDSIEVVVDDYGWVDFGGLYATLNDGDFFLVMYQGGVPPVAAPIGIDYDIPTVYRSYSYIASAEVWSLSSYQDFMMRAIVNGPQYGSDDMVLNAEKVYPPKPMYDEYIATARPNGLPGTVKSGEIKAAPEYAINSNRDATGYKVSRFSNFDPDFFPTPTGDTNVLVQNTSDFSYNDVAWGGLPEGWYAYGVAARYDQSGNVWSDYTFSNIVGHLLDVAVTINITTTNGEIGDSTSIIFSGQEYPADVHTHFTDETATVTFDPVWKGFYDLYCFKVGYETYEIFDIFVNADMTIEVLLQEKKYAPYNLYVDPLTSIATWNAPMVTALYLEDFEKDLFPPEGWQSLTNGQGWFRTLDGNATGAWPIPDWDSYFACANDDAAGSDNDGCCDYLITPALDLREMSGFSMKFDHFYDGAYGQLAFVEVSMDAGLTWTQIWQASPVTDWSPEDVDLSAYSHDPTIPAVWVAFHADDAGQWASGWCVDNVEVSVGSAADWPPMAYHVFLDDAYVAEVTEETYQYLNLIYGVEYTASVGALYSSGLSEKDYYTFVSEWLYPPENLAAANYDDAVLLVWEPPCAPWYEVVSVGPRQEMPDPGAEYSPIYREIKSNVPGGSRDVWDTQFVYPVGVGGGEAGVESDGTYIYSTKWNGGDFYRYDLDGTYLGSFTVSGASNVRDLAYDGEFFYGGAAANSCFIMNFDDEVLEGTINAPVAVRAIGYDEEFDGFWANNWSDNITLFDMDGVQLNSFACGSYASYYGFAWDDAEIDGSPYLYGFSQDGSGGVIVQMEIATGTETGVTYDAVPLGSSGDIAGGLFIQPGVFDPSLKTMGGMLQNSVIFGLEFGAAGTGPGTGCDVPDNVIGFNVYRDGEFIDYVEYFGEDQVSYWDYDLDPQTYMYTVTAVYDLAPYGFPGDIDESMEEGPFYITVTYGFPLPFFEDFDQGFEEKNWTVGCDNWDINSAVGNPANSAEFQWDPVLEMYDCGISTYPLLGNNLIDGDVFLDFDLMLDDRFDTVETEKMTVRVWMQGDWYDVQEITALGDFEWTSYHINISSYAMGNGFKVGFFANGENSINIQGWFVDNVNIYRLCAEPKDLTSEKVYETQDMGVVELNWVEPGAMNYVWISYNDGSFENAFCSTDGGAGLAQVMTPTEYPCTVKEVRYFNSSYGSYAQQNDVYILTGDGTTVLAGPYAVSDGGPDEFVTVDIDDIVISSGTFMVFTANAAPDGPFVGVDDSFYDGSLYFGAIGDFTELGQYGYFYVGSHEAYVGYESDGGTVVNSVLTAPKSSNNNSLANIHASNTSAVAPTSGSRDLTGYNIWRNDELIEANWPTTTYNDTVYEAAEYCYYISAVYDQCESDTLGYVCETFYTGIGDVTVEALTIFPNPAKDNVTIASPIAIERITVMNYVGQVVHDATVVDETTIDLNVSTYESGVYFIKVETEEGIATERVTITR